MRFYLARVYLNKGGYDSSGTYWGVGEPLWFYEAEDLKLMRQGAIDHIRAVDREAAKEKIRQKYSHVKPTFFR